MKKTLAIFLILNSSFLLPADGGSATWKSDNSTDGWNISTNWTPTTVPNGPADIASFAISTMTNVRVNAATEVNSIVFNPGASAYTITPPFFATLTVSGSGSINNSGGTQNCNAPDFESIAFTGSASAGT